MNRITSGVAASATIASALASDRGSSRSRSVSIACRDIGFDLSHPAPLE
jgi:hypothetical protein